MGAGGSQIKTKLSPQLGLAKLELGLSLAKVAFSCFEFEKTDCNAAARAKNDMPMPESHTVIALSRLCDIFTVLLLF